MRVTKTIKEYIQEEIAKKIPIDTNEQEAYEAMYRKIDDALENLEREIRSYTESRLDNLKYELNIPEDWKLDLTWHMKHGNLVAQDNTSSVMYHDWKEYKRQQYEKRRIAEREIILALELGGTKKDLDEMLTKIGVEDA